MNNTTQKVGAILLAAGKSNRMGGPDKIISQLNKMPTFWYPLKILAHSKYVHEITIVVSKSNFDSINEYLNNWNFIKTINLLIGGELRQDSVKIGLNSLLDSDIIIVHDAARPFLSEKMLIQGIKEVDLTGSSSVAIRSTDSLKIVKNNLSIESIDRSKIWNIQTPQFFKKNILTKSHDNASKLNKYFTDDTSLVESQGYSTKIFAGSTTNIKITTKNDLHLAEAIIKSGKLNES